MKILAAVLLVGLSIGFVASSIHDTERSSTEAPFSTETQHGSARTVTTSWKSVPTTNRAILRSKTEMKTTADPDEDPMLLGDPKTFLSPKDMIMQEIQTLDEEVSNDETSADFIDMLKAKAKKLKLAAAKKNVTHASAIKKLLDAYNGTYDDLTEEEENESQDDYDDEEDELDDDEQVMTGCPNYCSCAGEYAAVTTATCNKFVDEQTFGTSIAHLRIENADPIALGPHAFRSRGLLHLESITITDTIITELNQTAFDGVVYLFAVNLTGNGLQEVPPNLFENNTQVTLLSISRNPLKHSHDPRTSKHGLFESSSVTEFDYSGNGLTKLKRNAFAKMPNLIYINLRNNKLKEIDSAVFNSLDSLAEVDLSRNQLNKIPSDLFEDKEVETFNVAGNNLTTLPTIRAPELRQLDASHNKIRVVSKDALLSVPMLEQLMLQSNEIKWIDPNAFANLEMLTYLDLSNNKLTSLLDVHFIGNSRLEILVLNDNPDLETLPVFKTRSRDDDFSMSRFECTNCGLHTLHKDTFQQMPVLQKLNLSKNRLTALPDGLLRNLGSLRILDLSDNIISTLQNNMFNGASALTKLSLAGNPLETLQVSPFLSTPHLSKLDASRCALERVWSEARVPLESLKFLSVRENLLRRITKEELRATPKIVGLNLAHNPLDCDEEFSEAIQWLTDRGISPMEPFRYLNDYVNEDNYQDNEGISKWTDLAAVVCYDMNDGPPRRDFPSLKNKVKNMLDELDTSKDSDAILSKQNDEELLKLLDDRGMRTDEALEKAWTTQDQEYEDFVTDESTEYHPWYTSALWPVATIVIVTVMLVFLAVHVAFYLAKRRGGGPVIRPPLILRGGLIDNKNCGLVYKPLQEEIATPHMPKRGSFYSSSTFHYDKIVPESV
ncbi:leucine-rich repeat domain-containing glycoprotein 150 [Halictus rubicundus]|uniref:leucine-rich repeat domain-containing glycoprotein 150 n=1 Tax=Halictus rubicundus TaxID=77578 RepID=UPI0040368FB4